MDKLELLRQIRELDAHISHLLHAARTMKVSVAVNKVLTSGKKGIE